MFRVQFENNYFPEMCSGSEAGSYLRLIDFVYHSTYLEREDRGDGVAQRECELCLRFRKVDVRLSGKENSNSHGARPVHRVEGTHRVPRPDQVVHHHLLPCVDALDDHRPQP